MAKLGVRKPKSKPTTRDAQVLKKQGKTAVKLSSSLGNIKAAGNASATARQKLLSANKVIKKATT